MGYVDNCIRNGYNVNRDEGRPLLHYILYPVPTHPKLALFKQELLAVEFEVMLSTIRLILESGANPNRCFNEKIPDVDERPYSAL